MRRHLRGGWNPDGGGRLAVRQRPRGDRCRHPATDPSPAVLNGAGVRNPGTVPAPLPDSVARRGIPGNWPDPANFPRVLLAARGLMTMVTHRSHVQNTPAGRHGGLRPRHGSSRARSGAGSRPRARPPRTQPPVFPLPPQDLPQRTWLSIDLDTLMDGLLAPSKRPTPSPSPSSPSPQPTPTEEPDEPEPSRSPKPSPPRRSPRSQPAPAPGAPQPGDPCRAPAGRACGARPRNGTRAPAPGAGPAPDYRPERRPPRSPHGAVEHPLRFPDSYRWPRNSVRQPPFRQHFHGGNVNTPGGRSVALLGLGIGLVALSLVAGVVVLRIRRV